MTYQEVVEAVALALCLSDPGVDGGEYVKAERYRAMAISAVRKITELRLTAVLDD